MTKNISIAIIVIFLVGFSLYLNRERFASAPVQISHRSLPPRGTLARGANAKAAVNPVVFLISRRLELNSVQVFYVSDIETNKYPHPLWELVSVSNSIPVKEFVYGAKIRGMKPALKGDRPEPLQPGVNYRLVVKADSLKLEHDFVPVPHTQ